MINLKFSADNYSTDKSIYTEIYNLCYYTFFWKNILKIAAGDYP